MSLQSTSSRRGLFKRLTLAAHTPDAIALRPPGALLESEFLSLCERCDDCSKACPQQIIVRGDGGFPVLDFSRAGCTRCGECIQACQVDALSADVKASLGEWVVNESCLPSQKITCQSCKDACDLQAISFPYTSSSPMPVIDVNNCTGCGECVAVCPVNAIAIKPVANPERVNLP